MYWINLIVSSVLAILIIKKFKLTGWAFLMITPLTMVAFWLAWFLVAKLLWLLIILAVIGGVGFMAYRYNRGVA